LQVDQPGFIGCRHRVAVRTQAFAAAVELARLLLDAALVCGQHLYLLLHLGHAGALLVGGFLRLAQGFFQIGQRLGLVLDLGGQQLGFFFAKRGQFKQVFNFFLRLIPARGPLCGLLLKGDQALFDALAAFHHKTDLGFQSADLGTGLVQQALRLVDLIARRVVGLAHRLQFGLDVAQVRDPAFQRVDRTLGFGLDLALIRLGLGSLEKPELMLLERDIRVQAVEFFGDNGLRFQLFQVGVEFAQDVFDPGQVFTGV